MTMDRIHIQPIPAFKDNYIWMMHDGRHAVVVDPGAAAPVLKALDAQGLQLSAVLLTHLHFDHNSGVPGLLERGSIPVFGPLLNEHDRVSHPPRGRQSMGAQARQGRLESDASNPAPTRWQR